MSSRELDPAERQPLHELRELAESAARLGGTVARQSFGRPGPISLKADRSEVTEIDLAAERAIIAHIRQRRPDDRFVAEEATERRGHQATQPRTPKGNAATGAQLAGDTDRRSTIPNRQSVCWVIDPIDGTRNYIRDVPVFTCCVAAMRAGFPIAGAIYDPIRDVMYSADAANGTYVNGRILPIEEVDQLRARRRTRKLIVAIPSARHRHVQAVVRTVFGRHVVRNFGSTALHLAMVATGRFDAAVTSNSRLWDLAAGWLIITQAGGVMTRLNGRPLFPLDVRKYRSGELPSLAGGRRAHATLLASAGP